MAADGGNQEHQHRRMRERLKRDAIEEHPDRRDDGKRQRDVDGDAGVVGCRPHRQRQHDCRQHDIDREGAGNEPKAERPAGRNQVEQERHCAHRQRKPRRARHLARRQRCVGERAVGHEFALRNQDHAGHREHQHQRKAEQRIDRAIGDAVLDQEQHDRHIQDLSAPLARMGGALLRSRLSARQQQLN